MKKRVSKNSLIALKTSDFQVREWEVYRAILRAKKATRQQLVVLAGLPINVVCGRVTALLDRGLIEECGTEINPVTHKPNALLRVKHRKAAA